MDIIAMPMPRLKLSGISVANRINIDVSTEKKSANK